MAVRQPKYARSADNDRLWQGEVLSGLIVLRPRLETIAPDIQTVLDEVTHPYAIVLTQDCDLESDYGRDASRRHGVSLPSIILCEATPISALRGACPPGKDIWKRISQNKDERYHCLEMIPPDLDAAGQGVAPLGIDFKRYFTMPTAEVYRRIELGQAKRRARLITPYAEQLSCRCFHFQCRIALPEDHDVSLEPVGVP